MTWCAAKQNDFPIQFVAFPEVQAAVVSDSRAFPYLVVAGCT